MARYTDDLKAAHDQCRAQQQRDAELPPEDEEAEPAEACEDDRVLAQIDALIVAAGETA